MKSSFYVVIPPCRCWTLGQTLALVFLAVVFLSGCLTLGFVLQALARAVW